MVLYGDVIAKHKQTTSLEIYQNK